MMRLQRSEQLGLEHKAGMTCRHHGVACELILTRSPDMTGRAQAHT
jgi:hypothetical protein